LNTTSGLLFNIRFQHRYTDRHLVGPEPAVSRLLLVGLVRAGRNQLVFHLSRRRGGCRPGGDHGGIGGHRCPPYGPADIRSGGEGNRYGHPYDEVLQRVGDVSAAVLRTDELGTIDLAGLFLFQSFHSLS